MVIQIQEISSPAASITIESVSSSFCFPPRLKVPYHHHAYEVVSPKCPPGLNSLPVLVLYLQHRTVSFAYEFNDALL